MTKLKKYTKDLIDTFDFDGIRFDTIPNVPKASWAEFA